MRSIKCIVADYSGEGEKEELATVGYIVNDEVKTVQEMLNYLRVNRRRLPNLYFEDSRITNTYGYTFLLAELMVNGKGQLRDNVSVVPIDEVKGNIDRFFGQAGCTETLKIEIALRIPGMGIPAPITIEAKQEEHGEDPYAEKEDKWDLIGTEESKE